MAPTKANATYAVTTLSLLTKVTGILPGLRHCPLTRRLAKTFRTEKSALLSLATSALPDVVKET